MKFLPIFLNITDKKILIVGGGRVALRKIGLLERFTKNITIVAKSILNEIKKKGYNCCEREYSKKDLRGYSIIYACTDREEINKKIKSDAAELNILVNTVDNLKLSDFISPAVYKNKKMTVAVSSQGKDVKGSIKLRNKIKKFIENDNPGFCRS